MTYAPATNYVSSYQPDVVHLQEPTYAQDVLYVLHGQEALYGGFANGHVVYQDGPGVYDEGQNVHQVYVQEPGQYTTVHSQPVHYVDNGMGYAQQEPVQYVDQVCPTTDVSALTHTHMLCRPHASV